MGPIKYTTDDENPFLGREFRLAGDISQRTLDLIDEEVRRLIDEQYAAARRLVTDHRQALDRLAAALLKHETLTGDEVAAILRGDDVQEYRAAQARLQQPPPARKADAEPKVPPLPTTLPTEPGKPDVGLSGA